jgi:cytoskeletal protein RodZ
VPSVGEQLRAAREQQKLSVYDVAEITKIKTDHIRALEQGAYEAFAAPVYIRGFLRTYSTVLHLDSADMLALLEEELSRNERFQDESKFSLTRKTTLLDRLSLLVAKLNWRVVAVIVVAAVLIGTGTWIYQMIARQRSVDPLRDLGPGLYQPAKRPGGELLPLPDSR